MPNWPAWTPRLLIATNLLSLALNGVVAYAVLRAPRGLPVLPAGASLADGIGPGGRGPAGRTTERAPYVPFVREYQLVDRSTGRLIGAVLADDGPKLERFIAEAALSAEQERALRDRFARRRQLEMEMAQRMVREGRWQAGEFLQLEQQFWGDEYRALPPGQAAGLSPQFVPPPR